MKTIINTILTTLALVVIGVLVYAGYNVVLAQQAKATPAQAAAPAGPVSVTVKTIKAAPVQVWSEFSGRLHAIDYAEVRPEVSGRITEIRFQEGQIVKAGDILFVIDPRTFADAVARSNADVQSASARLQLADIQEKRMQQLFQNNAVSKEEVDNAESVYRVANADLAHAQAILSQDKVDLEHAYVAAPISGKVSIAEVTLGNVVQSGSSAPVLTSIVSEDGIYADFEVDEQTYLKTIRRTGPNARIDKQIPVQLIAAGEQGHIYRGYIQNFDNIIDTASGTIRARAKFANEDQALVPGMFVTVKLASQDLPDALLIPDRAVSYDQDKKYVLVVDDQNKVIYREVSLGTEVGASRVVQSGLNPGERIIVDGIQRVRPADIVDPQELPDTASTADKNLVALKSENNL